MFCSCCNKEWAEHQKEKKKGKETLQSLINTKGNKNKSLEHLLQALDGRIGLKLSAVPVSAYV